MSDFYRLRWRFDYADRGPKFGMWSQAGSHEANQAWAQNKEGLVRAAIEGENTRTHAISVLAECDGHDFRNFQWLAVGRLKMTSTGQIAPKPITDLVGMKLLTTNRQKTAMYDGNVIDEILPENIKKINFKTYGK